MFSSYQDQSNSLSKRAFAVEKEKAQLVNGIPVSGEDYLLLVRQQAEACVQTVVAPPPSEIVQLDLPFEYQFTKDTPIINKDLIPDPAWQSLFASCFEQFRKGKQDTKHISTQLSHQQGEDHIAQVSDIVTEPDLLPVIAPLSQREIFKLLKQKSKLLQSTLHTDESWKTHANWIFSLLVYVDPVLTSMDISILRDICRTCIDIRNKCQENETDQVIQLNIIITIISKVFKQSDLL
ncbi:survival motor neuron interacting protein 1-domain-containing protein [Halteromyces radiatus]|uniref:survival motor neuron interacting protein 1-domain-containing protein n=1 Tax=Halteromyces radiatus TaxID=101107 RepID=UPI00221FBAFB|nr:survival motor neuron interacting protein 1-domain-containing protein [Halteromyces radiatus]KAI8081731.1 survival motor neuron interacting protein 1-domain-containing protein [Halteromyces radiatus]